MLLRAPRVGKIPVRTPCLYCSYHTYPDPSDKGSVSTTKAADLDVKKQLDKSGGKFKGVIEI